VFHCNIFLFINYHSFLVAPKHLLVFLCGAILFWMPLPASSVFSCLCILSLLNPAHITHYSDSSWPQSLSHFNTAAALSIKERENAEISSCSKEQNNNWILKCSFFWTQCEWSRILCVISRLLLCCC